MTGTARYPDHHEGIRGRQLFDDLLTLDDRGYAHREQVLVLASHLLSAVMVGNPAPRVEAMYGRISRPRIGDLVFVLDACRPSATGATRVKGLGYFLATRREWADSEAERAQTVADYPDEDGDENRADVNVFYIQYGPDPGDVCRWTDCTVYMVPTEFEEEWV